MSFTPNFSQNGQNEDRPPQTVWGSSPDGTTTRTYVGSTKLLLLLLLSLHKETTQWRTIQHSTVETDDARNNLNKDSMQHIKLKTHSSPQFNAPTKSYSHKNQLTTKITIFNYDTLMLFPQIAASTTTELH